MDKYINTQCGIDKLNQLRSASGRIAKIRLYWFIIIASIRDRILKF